MDTWETLIHNSTITTGDAWEHLNAQGGVCEIIYGGSILSANVQTTALSTVATESLSSNILNSTLSANVDDVIKTVAVTEKTTEVTT